MHEICVFWSTKRWPTTLQYSMHACEKQRQTKVLGPRHFHSIRMQIIYYYANVCVLPCARLSYNGLAAVQ